VKVGIVGGTGPFGRGLALRLAAAGHDVTIGSRNEGRAAETAAAVGVRGASNALAAGYGDIVVIAVDADAAVPTVKDLRTLFRAPVLSVASQVEFFGKTARPRPKGSLAEEIAEIVDVPVTAGLHSIGAAKLARGRPEEDAFVCGNDDRAKELALALARDVIAGQAVDCGGLQSARALEAMTAVILNVNRLYKVRVGIRLTGLA